MTGLGGAKKEDQAMIQWECLFVESCYPVCKKYKFESASKYISEPGGNIECPKVARN